MNNGETNQNPAVTPYINEIALPSIAYLGFQIFDLDRIEVPRRSQGTLYGRNTTGGAINFITRRPTQELTADGRLDVGNFNSVEFEGGIGGGLTDTVAARLAVDDYHREGYQHLHMPDGSVDPDYGDVSRGGYGHRFRGNPTTLSTCSPSLTTGTPFADTGVQDRGQFADERLPQTLYLSDNGRPYLQPLAAPTRSRAPGREGPSRVPSQHLFRPKQRPQRRLRQLFFSAIRMMPIPTG